MQSCRLDGRVLKPDKPVSTTDSCFRSADPTCKRYHTYSDVAGFGRVHYFFNNDAEPMSAADVYLGGAAEHLVYNWYSGQVSKLEATNSVAAGYEGHIYAVAAPVVNGWALFGEPDKYVTASSTRFSSVSAAASDGSSLAATLVGVAGEEVNVCAARAADLKLLCHGVKFGSAGKMTVTFQ